MLYKLAAARLEKGFYTKKNFVDSLRKSGININEQAYNRMESGKQKIDVKTAILIAEFLKANVKELFFDNHDSENESKESA